MATVFNRVKFFCKIRKTFLLSHQDRLRIGKLVAEAYRSKNEKMPEKRIISNEPEGKFNIQWYPTEFIREIDAIISNFVSNPPVSCGTLPITKKRRIIPINSQPVKVNY